jgi:hypothetical protein
MLKIRWRIKEDVKDLSSPDLFHVSHPFYHEFQLFTNGHFSDKRSDDYIKYHIAAVIEYFISSQAPRDFLVATVTEVQKLPVIF